MGTTQSIAAVLFTRTQRGVLALLFGTPDRSYYTNEIVRSAGLGVGTVQRELEALAACGLVTSSRVGNQKHYRANTSSPIFVELRGIVQKTFGLADVLRGMLEPLAAGIEAAFVYGSVAKGTDRTDSDIDLMVIGDKVGYVEVMDMSLEAKLRFGRTVNPTVYKSAEFRRKLGEGNGFLRSVMEHPRVDVIGCSDELQESRKPRKNRKPEVGGG